MATTPGLRPLALGELLDASIKLYTRHWRVLMRCVVGFVLPVQVLAAVALLALAPEQLDPETADATRIATGQDPQLLAAEVTIALLQGLMYLLVTGACFKAVLDARLGEQPSAGDSLAFLRPRLPAVLAVFVLYSAGVTLGAFAFLFPGIWISVAWSLCIPALLFERLGPVAALGRSFRLVQGRWWRVFGTLLVGVLLVSLIGALVESLIAAPVLAGGGDDVSAAAVSAVAGTIGALVTAPFSAAVVTLLYFDQRVRNKDGDDALAEALSAPPEPAGAAPGTRWLPPEPPSPPAGGA